jgi:hypothetical protein
MSEINASGAEELNVALTGQVGPVAGFFVVPPLNDSFSLQAEALYIIKQTRGEFESREGRIRLTYIDTPLLLRYAAPSGAAVKLHIFGGAYGGFLLRATSRIREIPGSEIERDVDDAFSSFDFGWVAGLGLGTGGFRIDGRYNIGARDIGERPDLGGLVPVLGDVKFRNRGFVLLVGYHF